MRKYFLLLITLSLIITSCNDGDILTVNLEFEDELSLCGDVSSANYVIYKTKSDPDESLTLLFPVNATNNLIFYPIEIEHQETLKISSTSSNTVQFNYRFYDGDPLVLICQEIPSSTVNITKDYKAEDGGEIQTISTFVDIDGVRTVTVEFNIINLNIDILNTTNGYLGTYIHSYSL